MLMACTHDMNANRSHSLLSREEMTTVKDFLRWRKENHPLERCSIGMRSSCIQAKAHSETEEVHGILAEFFNYLASLPPNDTKSNHWCNPISITLGDAYVKNKYYVWTTSDYLSEINTRSVYVFPFHHDVLTSMPQYSISFEMNDEERVNLLREFNIRWNYVMEYIINRFAVDNASY